ncbi:MAG: hypothetical protein IIB13_04280 [Chloroflexi bacterium]|nr:hypothetical protein [Chloroflexota bacterium]
MKKLIIGLIVVFLLLVSVSCAPPVPAPAPAPAPAPTATAPANIKMTATISGLEKGEEAALTISLSPGIDPAGKPLLKQTIKSDGKRSMTVKITTSLEDGYYLLFLETPDKYFREPKGYLFMVSKSEIVNPTGMKVIFNLLPQPEGLVDEAYISLSAPPKGPPPPSPRIFSKAVPDEAYYLPGETVEVKLLFKNKSSNNVTLEYLPEIRVAKHHYGKPLSTGQALYSWTGRELLLELKPDETTTIDFIWDQKDTNGEQVPPGWYYVTWKDPNVTGETVWKASKVAMVLVRYSRGAIEKTIEVNESQTVKDITITLARIVLTTEEMMIYVRGTPAYIPPSSKNSSMEGFGEYSIDGGEVIPLYGRSLWEENRSEFHWGGRRPGVLDPVPNGAKELVFRIKNVSMTHAPSEIVEGPWEFRVSLE